MSPEVLQVLVRDAEAIRSLVGRQVRYLGEVYEISDVILEEDLMILSAASGTDVQDDKYGRAHRLVPRRHTLRFRDARGAPTHVWDEVSFLDA